MDSGRLLFDSGLARGNGGSGAQMLLFGGGGFFRGAPRPVLAMEEGRRKRPFFTTHEELIEEEYYDEQAPEKKRRLTAEQVQMLEKSFAEENKLEPERKTELARRLGMAPRQVAVWFQNRRARWKTKQLEQDFDYLKAAHDALLADHHALLKDNDRLRSQVISLTEKMECKNMSGSVTTAAQEAEPDEQTAVSATDTCTAAMAAAAVQLRGEDIHSTETNGSTVVMDVGEGTNHSGESYIAGEGYNSAGGGAAHSSEEEDGGAVSDEGCSFQLPEAVLAAMENYRHHVVEEEAHLGNWTSWFWN